MVELRENLAKAAAGIGVQHQPEYAECLLAKVNGGPPVNRSAH
jgi:hypothetical protein